MSDNPDGSLPPIDESEDLAQLYKERGFKKTNLKDYAQLKKQQKIKSRADLPPALKIFLSTPVIILFCIGLIFIPYMAYLYFTTPDPEPAIQDKVQFDPILMKNIIN